MNNPVYGQNFIQNLKQFRQSMQGQDPDKIIQQMMNNGRLTQGQYEQARQRAEMIQRMMSSGAQS